MPSIKKTCLWIIKYALIYMMHGERLWYVIKHQTGCRKLCIV